MLSDRPFIVPEFQGRSRDDHVVAVSLTENRYFGHFLNRPPIDTISNIYVRWGTIEDDDMTHTHTHTHTKKKTKYIYIYIYIYMIFYELASF